ncbi:MAG TPA: PD-(D/E)XK nuclease family protein, partial [Alphaproteobacteria bacterium]|nr:PD-(D/E)XK nuclease family protein [Alphaproteobacteria bacterium]
AYRPRPAPLPCPPVGARPRRLSVTEVAIWMVDPYAVYARHVLKLQPLEQLEADPGAAERGEIVHRALNAFVAAWPRDLPANAEDRLLELGREAFGDALAYPGVAAFWWPRFERIAKWFVMAERLRREAGVYPVAWEIKGETTVPGPAGPFVLTARADRIDRTADGGLAIVDYKTGTVPTNPQIVLGYAPQLPLEAVLLQASGFDGLPPAPIAELAHWRLSGGLQPGEIRPVQPKGRDMEMLIEEARLGLVSLVARFDDPRTPYLSQPRPAGPSRFGAYDHLARVQEWSSGGEGSD